MRNSKPDQWLRTWHCHVEDSQLTTLLPNKNYSHKIRKARSNSGDDFCSVVQFIFFFNFFFFLNSHAGSGIK